MLWAVIPVVLQCLLSGVLAQRGQSTCKNPVIAQRLLADDVRYASPFYVIALPRSSDSAQVDNVCYTYFETGGDAFSHIISVTYKDGSNKYHRFTKGDIKGSMGLAEGKAEGTACTFHDYTLTPICNNTVFVLYRCFIEGSCSSIDIGESQGVDVRVALAATPKVSQDCYKELDQNLRDTSSLNGGDYIILPHAMKPQCVTKYKEAYSIGSQRAAGSKEVLGEDPNQRFGGVDDRLDMGPLQTTAKPAQPTQKVPVKSPANKPSGTYFQTSSSGPGHSSSFSFAQSSSAPKPGVQTWQHQNQWSQGPNPWQQHHHYHGADAHYHKWQAQGPPAAAGLPAAAGVPTGNNVYYHIHNWENPPPNCCKCN